MKRLIILVLTVSLVPPLQAQKLKVEKVEPAFWWVGMKNPNLELLVYGKDVGASQVEVSYPGVLLREVIHVENPNYLFIRLYIDPTTKAGTVEIIFKLLNKTAAIYNLELKERQPHKHRPITTKDVVYLLMPDRFANGDPKNDNSPLTSENADRSKPGGRHGGDLQGIAQNLDYISDLGATVIWSCPLLENNASQYSYHGYAITDFYKIDPRFGTNEDYARFVAAAHEKGIKIIKDLVFNHVSSEHYWMKDYPMQGWINGDKTFYQTNYQNPVATDPYASRYDFNRLHNGWFVQSMPDLNQKNPHIASYLIQHSIFWIEFADIDGIRMDTYPYPDRHFMSQWMAALKAEYPDFFVVGEVWVDDPAYLSYWQQNTRNKDGYQSNLESVTDFPLFNAMNAAFGGGNTFALYKTLNQDFLYENPNNLLTFIGNHDTDRALGIYNRSIPKLKLAVATLLTTRGIPQLFYGDECLMDYQGDHGLLRADFPGGWSNDKVNYFTQKGLSEEQKDFLAYLKKILAWRKTADAVHSGKLTHFIPRQEFAPEEANTYVYFRHNQMSCIMVIINNQDKAYTLNAERFAEFLSPYRSAIEIISGTTLTDLSRFALSPNTAYILELKK